MNEYTICENLAFYLLEKTGTVNGIVSTRMTAADQRTLFGRFIGKGIIKIDGLNSTISHIRKVCFGLDYDVTYSARWQDIA